MNPCFIFGSDVGGGSLSLLFPHLDLDTWTPGFLTFCILPPMCCLNVGTPSIHFFWAFLAPHWWTGTVDSLKACS